MRMVRAATLIAVSVGFVSGAMARSTQDMETPLVPERPAAIRLSQGLPSDVEQRLGIPPNSANRGYRGRGGIPSDVEQQMRRRQFGDWGVFGGDDRLARCQARAHRRGLDGREFRRFVRYCMDR
jgi:hypothetical protein